MDEEEALRNYCRAMLARVRNTQQTFEENRRHKPRGAGGTDAGRHVASNRREPNVPVHEGERYQCQGPATVPLQLITALRIRAFQEEMRRAAEVELHGPAVCRVCLQEEASLALKTFISSKKTQLQFQTLKGRLNTRSRLDTYGGVGAEISQSPPMPLSGFGRNYLAKTCRSQQPGVALATTKERGVAVATDEMRGLP